VKVVWGIRNRKRSVFSSPIPSWQKNKIKCFHINNMCRKRHGGLTDKIRKSKKKESIKGKVVKREKSAIIRFDGESPSKRGSKKSTKEF